MKKNLLLLFLFVAVSSAIGVVFIACSPNSHNRTTDTATVSIDPVNPGVIAPGASVQFTALVRNNGNDVNTGVNWTVNPATLGTFNPNNVKVTTFTASSTVTGSGVITADVNGITKSVNVAVGTAAVALPDNIAVSVVPAGTAISNGGTASLTATLQSAGIAISPQPAAGLVWTVAGTGNGTVSPSSSGAGTAVTYTAPTTGAGTSSITVTYYGTLPKTAYIVYGSTGAIVLPKYMIYSDAGLGTGVSSVFGYYQGGTGGASMGEITGGGGAPGDTSTYQQIVYTATSPATDYAGWYIPFITPVDMSGYTALHIWLKGALGGEKVIIEVDNSASGKAQGTFTLTTTWTEYTVSIASIKSFPITNAVNIVFAGDQGCNPGTIDFDYVNFQ